MFTRLHVNIAFCFTGRVVSNLNVYLQPNLNLNSILEKSPYSEFFWSIFSAFGLNTKRYSVSLRIQSECRKIRTRKNPNKDTFDVVNPSTVLHEFLSTVLHICLRSKFDFRKLSTYLNGSFLIGIFYWSKINTFSLPATLLKKRLCHNCKWRDQKKNFQVILFRICWNFTMF